MRVLFVFLSLGLVAATGVSCTAKYEMSRPVTMQPSLRLDSVGKVYVNIPQDGRYESRVYEGSGYSTANAIVGAFSKYAAEVDIGTLGETCDESKTNAKSQGYAYCVCPAILHWEDRNTEWSGKRDRVQVRIQVFAVESGELIDAAVIDGKSKWATFGGDHPQDLLAEPFGQYASGLY